MGVPRSGLTCISGRKLNKKIKEVVKGLTYKLY